MVPLWPINLVDTQDFEGIDDDNERKLQPGEVVSLPETLLSTDKRKAKQTVWIRADREGEVKQKYEVRSVYFSTFTEGNVLISLLFGRPCFI